jgi:putative redox protein
MREITVNWNPAGPFRLEATAASGFQIVMDASPEFGGDGEGFSPKVLLLTSVGGCTAIDVLGILRKMRQEVTGYRVEVKGWEHDEHPKKFDKIVIEHIVTGRNLDLEAVNKAVHLSHEKYCGVSASLQGSVDIEVSARIENGA